MRLRPRLFVVARWVEKRPFLEYTARANPDVREPVGSVTAMKCLKRIRNRRHRCYELAAMVMLNEPGAEQFTLIHGRGEYGLDHAWIDLNDGRVYDPVADTYTPVEEYPGVVERRYTKMEAACEIDKTSHWGAWHVSPAMEKLLHSPEGIAWRAKAPARKRP